ncbi:MFS general substrate transporter [Gonapodya prolifera JEL478]|uniref:MFS general substrate transporter n=1 Tax=Gonapodya prolifera (strain JEL478) TaxID=1344416 RepID=A0A139AJW7_GONPJ|nr:MFS general substrate transporter [Gonapodya prolifera JEL478]|eukprot:KXS17077.1 MFS general substrate transporter [Gonapodya prolifera JEL478]
MSQENPPPKSGDHPTSDTTLDFFLPDASADSASHVSRPSQRGSATVWKRSLHDAFWGSPPLSDPRLLPFWTKARISAVLTVCSMAAAFSQHIYAPSLLQVQKDLGSSEYLTNLTVSSWAWAWGTAPMFWAAWGDYGGRKRTFVVSLAFYAGSSILSYFSPTVEILIVSRVLQGGTGCAVWIVGAGTIADMFAPSERGRAIGWFQAGGLIGSVIGPPFGGAFATAFGWRSTFLLLSALGVLSFVLVILFVPETLRTHFVPPRKEVGALSSLLGKRGLLGTVREIGRWWVVGDVIMATMSMVYFWSWQTYSPSTWSSHYGLNEAAIGLCYIPMAFGQFLVIVVRCAQFGGRLTDREIQKSKERHGGSHRSEDRLRALPWALLLFVPGMIGLAWSVQYVAPLAVALFCLFLTGVGYMMVHNITTTYVVDIYPTRPSSMNALLQMIKTVIGSSTPIWALGIFQSIGVGWYFTAIAVLNAVSLVFVPAIVLWGWAARTRVAPEADAIPHPTMESDPEVGTSKTRLGDSDSN